MKFNLVAVSDSGDSLVEIKLKSLKELIQLIKDNEETTGGAIIITLPGRETSWTTHLKDSPNPTIALYDGYTD